MAKKKGRGQTILLIIVMVLVVLFGVGQFFASSSLVSPQNQNASSTDQTQQGTQVIAYVPPTPASSMPIESGSCWTNSIAAPFRTDAWRCSVGNAIQDPCFQIASSTDLLCGVDPANPNSTSSFALKLTQPLPTSVPIQGGTPPNWAWLVQLADGTVCSPFTGTLPIAQGGISANYGCAPSVPGGEGLYIFGDLNASSSQWTADVGTLSATTSSLPTVVNPQVVDVATVWQ